jgi:hypothetical protein
MVDGGKAEAGAASADCALLLEELGVRVRAETETEEECRSKIQLQQPAAGQRPAHRSYTY